MDMFHRQVEHYLENVWENRAFYLVYQDQNSKPKLIFTAKHQEKIAVNDVSIVQLKSSLVKLKVNYNLNGILAKSISLPWMPWLDLNDCDDQVSGTDCPCKST